MRNGVDVLEDIIRFILEMKIEDVPPDIRRRAQFILLDSIGVMYYEKSEDEYEKVLWQGIQLVQDELDEGNSRAKGHPACHFLPSLLQIAKKKNASYDEVLLAFITGYEVGARFGEIITLKSNIHPHANWGILGGAAAIAKLENWDENKIKNALLLSAQFSFPTLWQSVLEGHEARNSLIGLVNVNLLFLPSLIQNGMSSSNETITEIFGSILGNNINLEKWNDDRTNFYIAATYFKFYSSCRFCHGPIDALKEAMLQQEIAIDEIVSIEVITYSSASKLNNQQPSNKFAGKFSIPYAIAQEIVTSTNGTLNDNTANEIARKVFVSTSDEINSLLPEIRLTRLIINLKNKEIIVEKKGAFGEEPISELEGLLKEKFQHQLLPYMTLEESSKLAEEILELRTLPYKLLI